MPRTNDITIRTGDVGTKMPKRLSTAEAENLAERIRAAASAMLHEHAEAIVVDIEKARADEKSGTVSVKLDLPVEFGTSTFIIRPSLTWERKIKHSETGDSDIIDIDQLKLKLDEDA